jgi:hypothetical protein
MNGKVLKLTRPSSPSKWPLGSYEKPALHLSNRNLCAILHFGLLTVTLAGQDCQGGINNTSLGKWGLLASLLTRRCRIFLSLHRAGKELQQVGHQVHSPVFRLPPTTLRYIHSAPLHPAEGCIRVFWSLLPFSSNPKCFGQV